MFVFLRNRSIFNFQKLFTTLGQQHPVIVLKDVSVRQLSLIIEYIYLGQCDLEPADLNEFKKVAASLDIKVELNVPSSNDDDVTSSDNGDTENEISYEDIMESSTDYLTGARKSLSKSLSSEFEPPAKKTKQQEKAPAKRKAEALQEQESSPSKERGICPHCERAMRKRDISYHSQYCFKNPKRLRSTCGICNREFELPVSCKLHEKKEHGLHQN